jgi:hypothetical protein
LIVIEILGYNTSAFTGYLIVALVMIVMGAGGLWPFAVTCQNSEVA